MLMIRVKSFNIIGALVRKYEFEKCSFISLLKCMAASITVHLQIFKRPQLLRFSTDLDETGIKIHGLPRSFM